MTHLAESFNQSRFQDSAQAKGKRSFQTLIGLSAVLLMAGGAWSPVHSQPLAPGATETRFSLTGLNQFDTGLDQGGDFDWYGTNAGLNIRRQFSSSFNMGANVSYGYERWSWDNPQAFGGQAPWGNISTPGLGLSLSYSLTPSVQLGVSPSIQWAGEEGVGTASSAIYGAVFNATNTFSKDLTLGLGLGMFRELGENQLFPFLAINWQLTDDLTLKNPLPAGPAGGAGLELSYELNPRWTISAGGAYRNYRFRLNDSGPYAGGIGQNRLIPIFARASYAVAPSTSVDFYAIAATGGNVQVESADGSQTLNTGYDTGLGLAVNLSHRF